MGGSVTAGNASQTSDGAAFVLVVSEKFVEQYKLKPIAKMLSYAAAGVEPSLMGIGPVEAIPIALKKAGLNLDDIDLIELNEAFASQSIAVINELNLDVSKVNINGGAIALIAIEDEFVIIARVLGDQIRMMISDLTFALDYETAADLIEILDLEFPEEGDDSQPGGDIDLLSDLGISEMELLTILDDTELYPEEQLEAIAYRLGLGEQFDKLIERN
jgi:putative tRNA adenosine deaminase-associated protein